MARVIRCECGYVAQGTTDDELLAEADRHIAAVHPDRPHHRRERVARSAHRRRDRSDPGSRPEQARRIAVIASSAEDPTGFRAAASFLVLPCASNEVADPGGDCSHAGWSTRDRRARRVQNRRRPRARSSWRRVPMHSSETCQLVGAGLARSRGQRPPDVRAVVMRNCRLDRGFSNPCFSSESRSAPALANFDGVLRSGPGLRCHPAGSAPICCRIRTTSVTPQYSTILPSRTRWIAMPAASTGLLLAGMPISSPA